ncbi:hypothetical protein DFH07DRAFT_313290 [Mycena maculata]|uniref:F-box domain-containing protein n=1 Tax=Mycena maculata TaxID=230809 RepID=A0AAD7JMG8_9AGAR|nr:hypothetical protein DFH07DRAFT_313290 [Mycena maculata]
MNNFALRSSEWGALATGHSSSVEPSHSNITANFATLARRQELLTTNEAPEGAEFAFIRSVVSQADSRLASLEEEISRLRVRLRQLEWEHASLSRDRAQNKGILSPLRKMPSEVLGEIFSWNLASAYETRTRCPSCADYVFSRTTWKIRSLWILSTPSLTLLPWCRSASTISFFRFPSLSRLIG